MVNKLLKRVSLKKKKIKIQFISNILFNYMYLIMLEYKFAIAQFPTLSNSVLNILTNDKNFLTIFISLRALFK